MPSTLFSRIKKSSICAILVFVLSGYITERDGLAASHLLVLALAKFALHLNVNIVIIEFLFHIIALPYDLTNTSTCSMKYSRR
jgi:hypothetical protein